MSFVRARVREISNEITKKHADIRGLYKALDQVREDCPHPDKTLHQSWSGVPCRITVCDDCGKIF